MRSRRPAGATVAFAVAGGALAFLVLLPDLVGLDRVLPFAVLVALRPQLAALAVVGTLLAALVLAGRRRRRPSAPTRPRAWAALLPVLAVALVAGGLVVPRAVPGAPPPAGGTTLTVLTLNAFEGRADPRALAAVVRAERPDVVVVPEAADRFRSRLAVTLPEYRSWTNAAPGARDVRGIVVLAAPWAGDVTPRRVDGPIAPGGPETRYPWAELSGGVLGATRLVAVHLVSPVPGWIGYWPGELESLQRWCGAPGPLLVVGDFNASDDHSAFRAGSAGCTDAATERGAALTATWRANVPRWAGTQIDHVLMRDGPAARDVRVIDVPGSDHRALLATVVLPRP